MKIIAGNQEIVIKDIMSIEQGMSNGENRECKRILLEGSITADQYAALLENDWYVQEEDIVLETCKGYNVFVSHELIISKVYDEESKLDKVLKPILEVLNDEQALTFVNLYAEWKVGKIYSVGERIRYEGVLYKCVTEHIAQAGWEPGITPSVWAKILTAEDGSVLDWEQPDSTNPYMTGDKVIHNGLTWISDVDNNVWEPGVYGWTEVI